MRIAAGLLTFLLLGAGTAQAAGERDCRAPVVTGKSPVRQIPGCDLPAKPGTDTRLRQENGFVDLGNGTKVKIGGRVRVDVGVRR